VDRSRTRHLAAICDMTAPFRDQWRTGFADCAICGLGGYRPGEVARPATRASAQAPRLVGGGPERPVAAGEEGIDRAAGGADRPGCLPGGPAVTPPASASAAATTTAAAAELDIEVVLVDVDPVAAVALGDIPGELMDALVVGPSRRTGRSRRP